jgi:hypothetical protein
MDEEIRNKYPNTSFLVNQISNSQVCWAISRANFVYAATPEIEANHYNQGVEYQLQIHEENPLMLHRVLYIFERRLQMLIEQHLVISYNNEYFLTSRGLAEASDQPDIQGMT